MNLENAMRNETWEVQKEYGTKCSEQYCESDVSDVD